MHQHLSYSQFSVPPDAKVIDQLESSYQQINRQIRPFILAKPEHSFMSRTYNFDAGSFMEPSLDLGARVLRHLDLNQDQIHQIMVCRELFWMARCKIVNERKALFDEFGALMTAYDSKAAPGLTQLPGLHADALILVNKMSQNLTKQAGLYLVFSQSCRRLLTTVQCAKLLLHSYPYAPPWPSIVRALIAQEKQKQEQAEMQHAAPNKGMSKKKQSNEMRV